MAPAPGRSRSGDAGRAEIRELARAHWGEGAPKKGAGFSAEVVDAIYAEHICSSAATTRLAMLEQSGYLERYLWPHFDAERATRTHVLSIVSVVNEKARERVDAWAPFEARAAEFARLLRAVLDVSAEGAEPAPTPREMASVVRFLTHCFASLEVEMVRVAALRLVSLPLWTALNPRAAAAQVARAPQLQKHWRHLLKKEAKARAAGTGLTPEQRHEREYVPSLLRRIASAAEGAVGGGAADGGADGLDEAAAEFVHRGLELLVDLLSQLPTRRFVLAVVLDVRLLVRCQRAPLHAHGSHAAELFRQLLELVGQYLAVQMDETRGVELSEEEASGARCAELQRLQRVAFDVPALREFALAPLSAVESAAALRTHFGRLSAEQLALLAAGLDLVGSEGEGVGLGKPVLVDTLVSRYARRPNRYEAVSRMPLYPDEAVLWDEHRVPRADEVGDACLALPKLNLQFLTLHDYLLRNFTLFRLEATHAVKEDVEDVVSRVRAVREPPRDDGAEGRVAFRGWARMALPLLSFRIFRVGRPRLGESQPSEVRAELTFSLGSCKAEVLSEWESLRVHDVLFLLQLQPPEQPQQPQQWQPQQQQLQLQQYGGGAAQGNGGAHEARTFGEAHGVRRVRGCEVLQMSDEQGNWRTGESETDKPLRGTVRKLEVRLDTAQFHIDSEEGADPRAAGVYGGFNLLMRRKPQENNFKAVLQCIRELVGAPLAVPPWLHDVLLGYGDPAAAAWDALPPGPDDDAAARDGVDFFDTFLDEAHVREAFPDHDVFVEDAAGAAGGGAARRPARAASEGGLAADGGARPPFRLVLPPRPAVLAAAGGEAGGAAQPTILIRPYRPRPVSPYPEDALKLNPVRFTRAQVAALRATAYRGLTVVVGPPGTGKTDTAVQIISNLCHAHPDQRTLVIAHSNQALNDIFEKVANRDLDERYLLRLGHGEELLETALDFSKQGRVNHMLSRRLELLVKVEEMAAKLGAPSDAGYTCESAQYFFHSHVLAKWEAFVASTAAQPQPQPQPQGGAEGARARTHVAEAFPFTALFDDAPQPLFRGASAEEDMEVARVCYAYLRSLFAELDECRAFELLRNSHDRGHYLLTKHAKVIAMTCTHAALKRAQLLELGFQYDNLVMEEAAQVLEIETFVPLVLQEPDPATGRSRLQRAVLIGDHHQLPPVVKNSAFQKYSRLDQSLFSRFVRLGVPTIELNLQGRARSGLADLYRWRYTALGDLGHVGTERRFLTANAGFAHFRQLVHVRPYRGQGEQTPVKHFFQNLGEAEYVVATYMYMRLLGYPAERISMLTPYNGQRALLADVVAHRCAPYPEFGAPAKIATTDKYQGQQNDYILLSLVRTKHVGHIRDVRRLVVSLSRSRLGMLVFCDRALYAPCEELKPALSQLTAAAPDRLQLLPHERYPTARLVTEPVPTPLDVVDTEHMMALVAEMAFAFRQQAAEAGAALQREPDADVQMGAAAEAEAPAQEGEGADGRTAKRARASPGSAEPAAAGAEHE